MAASQGNWPAEYRHTQAALTQMIDRSPHYEDSWNGDLLALFARAFPATDPHCYIWKPQYNLRLPINPTTQAGTSSSAPPRTSTDSNNQTVRGRDEKGSEPGRLKPDFVIAQGRRGAQTIVAVIEIKRRNDFNAKDLVRFMNYCNRVEEMAGGVVTERTTALLIGGGTVYEWTRPQISELVTRATLENRDLVAMHKAGKTVRVDSVAFLKLLEGLRARFTAP
ncbi:hypothetical protein FRC12_021337 [Ceratobasidium sp. 428]|nr:hypothetical protein FRC12_021337 [Ceratobasidium sp. 428]